MTRYRAMTHELAKISGDRDHMTWDGYDVKQFYSFNILDVSHIHEF